MSAEPSREGGATARVLIVDDHELFREGLRLLLTADGVTVVGEATDGQRALQLIGQVHPDIILMDVTMPGMNGLTALARTKQLYPRLAVIMLSAHKDERYVRMAFGEGASGYVLKDASHDDLLDAIAAVSRGLQYIGRGVDRPDGEFGSQEYDEEAPVGLDKLTVRQRQVLQLLAEGLNVRGAAERLGISPKTVESHRAQLMVRLGIDDLAGLVRFAIRMGLVDSEQ